MASPALILPAVTSFPPSFGGNELAFGWALFSLTAMSSFSAAVLGQLLTEARMHGTQIAHPIGIVRCALACLLSTILLGTIGDVACMLAWGEVSPRTLRTILETDRVLDTAAFLPFFAFGALLTRGRPVVIYQLLKQPIPTDLWPTWPMVRSQTGVIALILAIAAGVTLAK